MARSNPIPDQLNRLHSVPNAVHIGREWFPSRPLRSPSNLINPIESQLAEITQLVLDQTLRGLQGALLDRLTHHVHILEMNGESYRLKHSRNKQQ